MLLVTLLSAQGPVRRAAYRCATVALQALSYSTAQSESNHSPKNSTQCGLLAGSAAQVSQQSLCKT